MTANLTNDGEGIISFKKKKMNGWQRILSCHFQKLIVVNYLFCHFSITNDKCKFIQLEKIYLTDTAFHIRYVQIWKTKARTFCLL
jgi:hypothetical protein